MGDSANQATAARPGRPETARAAFAAGAADGAERPVPRHGRAALLRLAAWFEGADAASAHEVFTAAFAVHPARHLSGTGEEAVAATASWWDAPAVGAAAAHPVGAGSVAPVDDHSEQQARLRDAAEAAAHWRRSAAQEVRRLLAEPTGGDDRLHLSDAALQVLMELLTAALGSGDAITDAVSAGDLELDIRLHVRRVPDASITLSESGGDLVLEGLRLQVTSYARQEPAPEDGAPAGADLLSGPDPAGRHSGLRLVRPA
ncbi:hypothetical protein HDA32_004996 [Spinactinospora alkalitolerans]|uniref:Uncharacterized protein n=1 Tax=Spinactinospora alkalitolerans TaxID=687207 RepID=A0A852TZ76_9ACTN|nr:DUF2397 family protein [Spinactinospora alkalitolerans]NYE49876.1 hypothetical protein [Spinactinospora alkalitolerans]